MQKQAETIVLASDRDQVVIVDAFLGKRARYIRIKPEMERYSLINEVFAR